MGSLDKLGSVWNMCKAIPPRMKVDTVVVPAMARIIIMMNLYSLDAWDAWVAQIF